MENGFQGKEGQKVPEMTSTYCESVSNRYIELYEKIAGEKFAKSDNNDVAERIKRSVESYLSK
jgi:phosphoribosylaminoimidazole-succinocarboxamide synthase